MKLILRMLLVSLIVLGITATSNASMIYSDNDYSCGWENYASDITNKNSFEIGVNLAIFAGGKNNISIAQLNYGGGDWYTDYPADMINLKSQINALLPSANVTVGTADLGSSNLSDYDLLIMVGHNYFTNSNDQKSQLKTYLDEGGVLFVDDCAGSPAISGFEQGFNELVFAMYGITNASMAVLPSTHQIYSSYYTLNGNDFSYSYAGNGTEWAQFPLKGYENHPEENNPQVPEPSTFMLFGSLLTGISFLRKKFNS